MKSHCYRAGTVADQRPKIMSVSEVARLAERSESGIRRLDHVLRPERTASGMRIYDRDVVEKYFASRSR